MFELINGSIAAATWLFIDLAGAVAFSTATLIFAGTISAMAWARQISRRNISGP